jgi:hypothetical protein
MAIDKIKAQYETVDEVPESFRDLYEERQGKMILTRIEGLASEADIHRLTTANNNLRTENSGLKSKLDASGGKTAEEYHKLEEQLQEAKAAVELAGKPDEEKINALVETRIKSQMGPVQRELEQTKKKLAEQEELSTTLQTSITKSKVSDSVRTAAGKAKVVASAVEDILALAGGVFEVIDIDGKEKVVTRDGIGVTPGLDPEAYFSEVAPNKPHWFEGSQGAGATGGRGGGTINGANPWSADGWNVTQQAKFYREHGPDKANQYAKAAGSAIGATSPPRKR